MSLGKGLSTQWTSGTGTGTQCGSRKDEYTVYFEEEMSVPCVVGDGQTAYLGSGVRTYCDSARGWGTA